MISKQATHKLNRKLVLNRETVRDLTENELSGIAGGTAYDTDYQECKSRTERRGCSFGPSCEDQCTAKLSCFFTVCVRLCPLQE